MMAPATRTVIPRLASSLLDLSESESWLHLTDDQSDYGATNPTVNDLK